MHRPRDNELKSTPQKYDIFFKELRVETTA